MYSQNRVGDIAAALKAMVTNVAARILPQAYVRCIHETGRGRSQNIRDMVAYYHSCNSDYLKYLSIAEKKPTVLADRIVLEYGPGSILGTPLLFFAQGASRVDCFDRFPLVMVEDSQTEVYKALLASLSGLESTRAASAFVEPGVPSSGFCQHRVGYHVTGNGCCGSSNTYDFIVSRSVMQHVDDLESLFADMHSALKPGGFAVHKVDLTSVGLDRYRPLDFLTWSRLLYRLMYAYKGYPNRRRINYYLDLARRCRFEILLVEPTGHFENNDVEFMRPYLAREFRGLKTEDLNWSGFWIVLAKQG